MSLPCVFQAYAGAGVPAVTNVPEAKYPQVSDDRCASFKIYAPEAKDVKVDICGRKYDMTRDVEGTWSVTPPPLIEGFHY